MNNQFYFQVPFTKVDQERRVVVGIATADNIDKADDIVDFNASVDAFNNWIGNIREMHGPKAVGKALSYRPVDFVSEDGVEYKGIEVEAYVSKGAEDTWQKVLDGTLTGFSIGGMVQKVKAEYHTTMKKMVRRIVKYSLGELSLVDNPCNPAAQISVVKSYNGTLMYDLEDDEITEKAERNPRSDRASATPAPPKDRVRGSEENPAGSAASTSSGGGIDLSEAVINSLKTKVSEHNDKVEGKESWRKASLSSLKAVYRRGAGAYSVSHRPGMTRGQWAMARVNAFLTLLAQGSPRNARYTTDNDLLPSGHPKKTKNASSDELEKAESYSPPAGVRAEARRALEWIKEGHAGSGFTDVGRRRASQLANGQAVSLDTIKRMSSYLARHQVDKQGKGWSPGEEGYPSPGRVAWAAWGGDPAVGWTNRVLRSANAMEKVARAEIEYVDAMLEIVEEYGKLADGDGNGIWVGYVDAENNDNIDIGVKCENCYFYIGEGECSIIAESVEPGGYCRLAAIPSKDIEMQDMDDDMDDDDMEMMSKSNDYDVFFCQDCGIATYSDNACSACNKTMILIGNVTNFDFDNVSKMIDSFIKGGAIMNNLQKNENDDNIASMEQDSPTISAAAAGLITKVVSSMVPNFNVFSSGENDDLDKKYKSKEEEKSMHEDEEEEKSMHEDEDEEDMEKTTSASSLPLSAEESSAAEESFEGGENVNTEELLKSLTELIDGKLSEFKEDFATAVDEKIETAVAKSVEVEPEAEESLEKSEEVEGEKDELIKGLMDRIEKLESTGAVKKSLDDDTVDVEDEVIKKSTGSVWDGYFIPAEVVHALGYES
jgi:hypothetical protein